MNWKIDKNEILVEIDNLDFQDSKIYTSGVSDEELDSLVADIEMNGQLRCVYPDQNNQVLDGRRRCLALKKCGKTHVRVRRVTIKQNDILSFQVSANLYRAKTEIEKLKEAFIILTQIARHQGKKLENFSIKPVDSSAIDINKSAKVIGLTPNELNLDSSLEQPQQEVNLPSILSTIERSSQKPKTPREKALEISGAESSPRTFDKVIKIIQTEQKHPEAGLMTAIEKGKLKIDKAYQIAKVLDNRNDVSEEIKKTPTFSIPIRSRQYTLFNKSNWDMSEIEDESIDFTFTSHPYWNQILYTNENEMGQERTVVGHIGNLLKSYSEVRKKHKKSGNLLVNMKGTYCLHDDTPEKKLVHNLVEERFKFMMADIGWHLRDTLIWNKVGRGRLVGDRDRKPENSYEPIFWFVKSADFYYKPIPIPHDRPIKIDNKEVTRIEKTGITNYDKTFVTLPFDSFSNVIDETHFLDFITARISSKDSAFISRYYGKHPAPFPSSLVLPLLLQFCPDNGVCLEPFMGRASGLVAPIILGHTCFGYETDPKFFKIAKTILEDVTKNLAIYTPRMEELKRKFNDKFFKVA